jgi:hypothetical protein
MTAAAGLILTCLSWDRPHYVHGYNTTATRDSLCAARLRQTRQPREPFLPTRLAEPPDRPRPAHPVFACEPSQVPFVAVGVERCDIAVCQ